MSYNETTHQRLWSKTTNDFEPSNFILKNNLPFYVLRTNVIFVTVSQIIHAYEREPRLKKVWSMAIKPENRETHKIWET